MSLFCLLVGPFRCWKQLKWKILYILYLLIFFLVTCSLGFSRPHQASMAAGPVLQPVLPAPQHWDTMFQLPSVSPERAPAPQSQPSASATGPIPAPLEAERIPGLSQASAALPCWGEHRASFLFPVLLILPPTRHWACSQRTHKGFRAAEPLQLLVKEREGFVDVK